MFGWQRYSEAVHREIEVEAIRFLRRELGLPDLILFQHRRTMRWGLAWRVGHNIKELGPVETDIDGRPYITRDIVNRLRWRMRPRNVEAERQQLELARKRQFDEYCEYNEMDDDYRADARKTFRGKYDNHPCFADLRKYA